MCQALILSPGRERLALSPRAPAPLVEVGGRPLLERLIEQLAAAGVEQAVLVAGRGEGWSILRALRRRPALLDLLVVVERRRRCQRGQIGAMLAARRFFNRPFLLAFADHLYDDRLVRAMARRLPPPEYIYGLVETDPSRVLELESALKLRRDGPLIVAASPALETFDAVAAGLFSATPSLFDELDAHGVDDRELGAVLSRLGRARAVFANETRGAPWCAVRTAAGLVAAERLV
jgi:choline kinase